MDTESEIERLRARVAEAEALAREANVRAREAEDERKRVQQENERLGQDIQLQHPTTLSQYLEYCHRFLFLSLRIRPSIPKSTTTTKVNGKFYPCILRPWEGFVETQQRHFSTIKNVLKDERIFPSYIAVREMQRRVCETPVANEDDIRPFEQLAVEGPVKDLIHALCANIGTTPELGGFNVCRISFANHSLDISQEVEEIISTSAGESTKKQRRQPSTKKIAAEPKEIRPDRRCIREDPAGNCTIAFVVEYKAAHKLQTHHLRQVLRQDLFADVITRRASTRASADNDQASQDASDLLIAMVITQTYDYMIRLGLEYGYVTAGKSFLFLWVKEDEPSTLYYALVDPGGEAEDEDGEVKVFGTAVAQAASFSLLALRSETRPRHWVDGAKKVLREWPIPYPGMEHETEEEEVANFSQSSDSSYPGTADPISPGKVNRRTRSTCKDVGMARKRRDDDNGSDGGDDGNHHDRQDPYSGGTDGLSLRTKRKNAPSPSSSRNARSDGAEQQTRQYCTQACLLGLKRGYELDENCPNVSSHRTVASSSLHPIGIDELGPLIQEQLAQCLDRDCEPLEKYGMYGAIGVLFKLSLEPYGYTFVGKGTIHEFVPHLLHEARVYGRLEKLQGHTVPVFLGNINLVNPYHLTAREALYFAGTSIVHMLLMSWVGESATTATVPNLAAEVAQSLRAIWNEGVMHGDERPANLLWSEERRCVMAVDFNRANLIPTAKHRQVEKLSRKKRRREENADDGRRKQVVQGK